jgi:hypothetical protein
MECRDSRGDLRIVEGMWEFREEMGILLGVWDSRRAQCCERQKKSKVIVIPHFGV